MRGTVGGGPCRPSTLGGGGLCVNYTGAAGRHFNRARSQANRQMNDLNLIEPVASGSKRERGTGSLSPQGGNQPNPERGAFCRTSDPVWLSNKSRTHIRKGRRKVELIQDKRASGVVTAACNAWTLSFKQMETDAFESRGTVNMGSLVTLRHCQW